MVCLNHAISESYARGPTEGLQRLTDMSSVDRGRLRPWWDCAIAEAYRRLGQMENAVAHWNDALLLASNTAQRELIRRKLEQARQ